MKELNFCPFCSSRKVKMAHRSTAIAPDGKSVVEIQPRVQIECADCGAIVSMETPTKSIEEQEHSLRIAFNRRDDINGAGSWMRCPVCGDMTAIVRSISHLRAGKYRTDYYISCENEECGYEGEQSDNYEAVIDEYEEQLEATEEMLKLIAE